MFKPLCSKDQKRLYANRCHARCALGDKAVEGEGEVVDCLGLNIVIPGKTKVRSQLFRLIHDSHDGLIATGYMGLCQNYAAC